MVGGGTDPADRFRRLGLIETRAVGNAVVMMRHERVREN